MISILTIETATDYSSVALCVDGEVRFTRQSDQGYSHASILGVYVDETIAFAQAAGCLPQAVAVSSGPGSYTGLRIGVSMAKGLCLGWGVPLIAIPTLELLASTAIARVGDREAFYCAMLDARRMEVYAAVYDARLSPVREVQAEVVSSESFADLLRGDRPVYFLGNGAGKCRPLLSSTNALFTEEVIPLAAEMAPLAEAAFRAKRFEDVAYFEPFYLKEFVAIKSKNKVLGQ